MFNTVGSVIDGQGSGKSDPDTTVKSDGGNPGGSGVGETIHGFATDSPGPDTERIASGGSSTGKRGRGRPSGSGRKPTVETDTKESVHLSKISLESLLYSIHLMGAEILHTRELALDREEAKKLSDAIINVSKYYNVAFDPKKVALFELATVAGGIYGTRLLAIRNRAKRERPIEATPIRTQTTQEAPSKPNGKAGPDLRFASPSAIFGDNDGSL